ncbi:putative protein pE66L [African swine fever virus]|nr:putative protein pE66L [African swine fever virus]WAS30579.1 putative protein pE66L [African swine fever virus]
MLTMASLARFIINTASFNKSIYPLSQVYVKIHLSHKYNHILFTYNMRIYLIKRNHMLFTHMLISCN